MRTLHLAVGAAVLVAFLLTGQYMDYLDVRSGSLGETTRVMFRSRHIYVLLAGLVNLAVGAYFVTREAGWGRNFQFTRSLLVLVSPPPPPAAFFTQPGGAGLPGDLH